jgi:cysteine desulfurase family protein (TIGR01976 family)
MACRRQFPALARLFDGREAVFFDGPAGSQTPRRVMDAMVEYMTTMNANHGGAFATSRASDALLAKAHQAVADLVGTDDPQTIVFGANMTTLTFGLSRALAKTWKPGDEVLVTRLDHDANVSPWVLAARDAGAIVKHVEVRPGDCTLDLEDLARKLSDRTRLMAVGCASNAVGTINPVAEIGRMVHKAGGKVLVDAVHYAPHRAMDVREWDCDYLLASAYKFFGPHVGVLWGRRELLASLPAYKVRPASDELPDRWMSGTQSHEGIAGVLAAVEYLVDLGRQTAGEGSDSRTAVVAAYETIAAHEESLLKEMLAGLAELKSVKVWGIVDPNRLAERAPTVSFTHAKRKPREVAEFLAAKNIFCWHGNFYALPLTERLSLEPEGMVRVGLLHYNTREEVQRLLTALRELE